MENPVIIFGAKGLGKVALEIFRSNGVVIYCFLDDDEKLKGTEIQEATVLGKTDEEAFLRLLGKKCEAFVASDDNKYRQSLTEMLKERKIIPVNAVHQKAYISPSARLGHGNFIDAGAFISSSSDIADHCVLHTGVLVEHDVAIEDYVQIGAGSIINSGVKISKGAFIGSGVTIVSGIKIGKNARIGAGSIVVSDVAQGETVFGNPAAKVTK